MGKNVKQSDFVGNAYPFGNNYSVRIVFFHDKCYKFPSVASEIPVRLLGEICYCGR